MTATPDPYATALAVKALAAAHREFVAAWDYLADELWGAARSGEADYDFGYEEPDPSVGFYGGTTAELRSFPLAGRYVTRDEAIALMGREWVRDHEVATAEGDS